MGSLLGRSTQVALILVAAGCARDDSDAGTAPSDVERTFAVVQADLEAAITRHPTSVPFTLLLANENGTFFSASKGASSADERYESASISKWVTSAVILDLVDHGWLSLDSRPQDFIRWWTSDSADARSRITLAQLLSFTSGLQPPGGSDEPCVSLPVGSLESCVERIYLAAAGGRLTPGKEFVYGSHHMQVAGLMAIHARGVSGWREVFDGFKASTGLFPTAAYDLPSLHKPRLAGGMHWTANESLEFLGRLAGGGLLRPETRARMWADHTGTGSVVILASPIDAGLGEAWHYGLGVWRECASATYLTDCDALDRVSSPGAYGAYPFVSFRDGYWGILARQGSLGTFRDGIAVYRDLGPLVEELAQAARQ